MAQKVRTVLISDLSGREIAHGGETISFTIRGISYEIDLTGQEAAAFDKAVAVYVDHARRLGGQARSGRPDTRHARMSRGAAMRRWAKDNGYRVSDRGRIPDEVQQAYQHANP